MGTWPVLKLMWKWRLGMFISVGVQFFSGILVASGYQGRGLYLLGDRCG